MIIARNDANMPVASPGKPSPAASKIVGIFKHA
mgnify:CR=1 FL=1